jgi:hypothetical protein
MTFLLLGLIFVSAASAESFGTLGHDGVEMEIVSAVAILDPGGKRVAIHLLPFEPSSEEVERLQQGRPFWIDRGRPSPNKTKWPDWVPYATYRLHWDFNPDKVGDHSKASIYLYTYRIAKNVQHNNSYFPGDIEGTIDGILADGEEIVLTSKHEGDISWSLNVRAKVFPKAKR